ncbi:hypothetical protein [Rubrimonas cliftonensis]|uniref:hypothetical protein n=1 Tax=Rubrimonas cliftonensis TaxID=89524 RepID=UPI001114FAF4|nr:hypothetical protein [Rubrimonas cliftonensis]
MIDGGKSPSGGGPEDPMIEARVGRLEEDVREIKADIREMRRDVSELKDRFSRMEVGIERISARLDSIPNVWQFAMGLVTTVVAVAALLVSLR